VSDDTGGEAPSEFTVELEGSGGTTTSTTSATSAELTDLVNGSAYRVRVAATNSAGTGEFSPWTDDLIPLGLAGAPTGLTGTAFEGGVNLQWVTPDDTGGAPIEDYVVQWISDGVEVALTTDTTSVRLETLANGTRYEFRVAAQTAAGVGEWSDVLVLTPRAEAVSAPTDVTLKQRARRVTVTWSAPAIGEPIRYVIAVSINGKSFRTKKSSTAPEARFTVSTKTKTLAVRVLAIDSNGKGPWSQVTERRLRR